MEDIQTRISRLERPQTLVRTARHGIESYNRLLHLRRLLKSEHVPSPGQALVKLLDGEAMLEAQRLDHRADYSVARHVEFLIAIMCEARSLKAIRARKLALETP